MYVCMYIYTYIYTWTRALTRLVLVTTRVATVSNDFIWDCQVRITRPFGCPLFTCASSCDASNAWPLGPAAFSEKSGKKGLWHMVPYGIWMLIPIHWFINPVNRSQLILTVDKDSPTGEYGRYWRSLRIHLQRITMDRQWWIKSEIILWSISSTTPVICLCIPFVYLFVRTLFTFKAPNYKALNYTPFFFAFMFERSCHVVYESFQVRYVIKNGKEGWLQPHVMKLFWGVQMGGRPG